MTQNSYKYYNHLGSFSPFYFINDKQKIEFDSNFSNLIKKYNNKPCLDITAISEILGNRFMLADRTIIQDIHRSPWLAKPNDDTENWEYFKLQKHKEEIFDENKIAKKLFKLLCDEIKNYIGNSNKIGILLSGGMDSRIVAGCLDFLIKTEQINIESVTAYTWGNPKSRDVVYAKEIAIRLDWSFKHYEVSEEDLWNNFKISGIRGAEYSGIHLHAIPQIQKDIDVDLLLVGSYGDSIGRGEYEGIKVENLVQVGSLYRNFGKFLKVKVFKKQRINWKNDLLKYHKQFPESKKYQQYELDFQLHYMRRLLNPCMEVLNEKVPTYQVFTNPDVFQFMWSLDPSCRKDTIYNFLMNKFHTKLNDIPWARTGIPYLGKGEPDCYLKNHHSYSDVIHNKLIDKIEERIFSGRISRLNIFNMKAIKSILKLIRLSKSGNFDYLERLSWLVSLDYFIENNNIEVKEQKNSLNDFLNAYIIIPFHFIALSAYRWWDNRG